MDESSRQVITRNASLFGAAKLIEITTFAEAQSMVDVMKNSLPLDKASRKQLATHEGLSIVDKNILNAG